HRVCDIGCGYGTAALYWAETRQWEMVGVTVSSKQQATALNRAQARTKGIPRSEFLLCDWLDNDFRNESFDAVTSIECLSHIADKEGFFREVERTLKPGRQLSLSAWISGKKTSTRRAKFLLEPICAGGQFPSLVGSGEIRSLAESAGLVVEELREVGPLVKKTWRIILWRLLTRLLTRREYRRFLGKDARNGWLRTLTVLRVWIAFELGVLDYALLRAKKRAS
ncbi:MAG: class I SAM-dependent methyltransferase, partial [Verrucomicrobiota bacterium]